MAHSNDQGDKRAGENALMESCQVVLDKDAGTLKVCFSSPTCSHSTIRLVLALTSVPGWHSLDLDAVCAFISSDLAEGEHVYMKGPPGYDIGDGNCLSMLKCIYGLVQAPRQYYMLCREVYQKAGLKQLHTDAERSVVTDAA